MCLKEVWKVLSGEKAKKAKIGDGDQEAVLPQTDWQLELWFYEQEAFHPNSTKKDKTGIMDEDIMSR